MFAPERGSVVRDWIHIQMATQQPTATPLLPLMHLSPMINDQMLLPSPSMILAAGVERGGGHVTCLTPVARRPIHTKLPHADTHRLSEKVAAPPVAEGRKGRGGIVRRT